MENDDPVGNLTEALNIIDEVLTDVTGDDLQEMLCLIAMMTASYIVEFKESEHENILNEQIKNIRKDIDFWKRTKAKRCECNERSKRH